MGDRGELFIQRLTVVFPAETQSLLPCTDSDCHEVVLERACSILSGAPQPQRVDSGKTNEHDKLRRTSSAAGSRLPINECKEIRSMRGMKQESVSDNRIRSALLTSKAVANLHGRHVHCENFSERAGLFAPGGEKKKKKCSEEQQPAPCL